MLMSCMLAMSMGGRPKGFSLSPSSLAKAEAWSSKSVEYRIRLSRVMVASLIVGSESGDWPWTRRKLNTRVWHCPTAAMHSPHGKSDFEQKHPIVCWLPGGALLG